MADEHIKQALLGIDELIAAVPSLFAKTKVKTIHQLSIVESALIDINRLANALERVAAKDFLRVGDIATTTIDDASGIKAAVDDLAERVPDIERRAVAEFVGWLSTLPGTTKIGASYEVPSHLVDQFMEVKNAKR